MQPLKAGLRGFRTGTLTIKINKVYYLIMKQILINFL